LPHWKQKRKSWSGTPRCCTYSACRVCVSGSRGVVRWGVQARGGGSLCCGCGVALRAVDRHPPSRLRARAAAQRPPGWRCERRDARRARTLTRMCAGHRRFLMQYALVWLRSTWQPLTCGGRGRQHGGRVNAALTAGTFGGWGAQVILTAPGARRASEPPTCLTLQLRTSSTSDAARSSELGRVRPVAICSAADLLCAPLRLRSAGGSLHEARAGVNGSA
jgi:hypothetical protein